MRVYTTTSHGSLKSAKRGSVIVFVLGLIIMLSFIVVRFLQETMSSIHLSSYFYNRTELRAVAYSALEMSLGAMSEIKEIDGNLTSPAQGWGNLSEYMEFDWGDIDVTVTVKDESGKVSIHETDIQLWTLLFEELEIDFSKRQELADSLLDWIDEDELERLNGAETDWYESNGRTVTVPNAAPKNLDEVLNIRGFADVFLDEEGMQNELFKKFKESVTLYTIDKTNLNTASNLVLETLGKLEDFDPQGIIEFREGIDTYDASDDVIILEENLASFGIDMDQLDFTGIESRVFAVTVEVRIGDAFYKLTGVVDTAEEVSMEAKDPEGDTTASINYPVRLVALIENE